MSELDLRLDWVDQDAPERPGGDHYQGGARGESQDQVIERSSLAEPEDSSAYPEEFQWSHERALALDRALGRLLDLTVSRLQIHLRELLAVARGGEEVQARLDLTEAWIGDRLTDWQSINRVRADDPAQAAAFNQGLEAGSNALGLALEVVDLIRSGEWTLADRLVEQVGVYLLEARDALLAAEPEVPPEPPP